MNWLDWFIRNFELIFDTVIILLFIILGVPFIFMMVIPAIVHIYGGSKYFPKLDYLIKEFNVDIHKPPYSEWMDKHPLLFVGMTSLELYSTYYIINFIKILKKIWRWVLGKSG
jgi:hypothetical protein